ncbi:hypothetical protein [Pseudorhodoferax sp. Leaf267]|uniref:hypothetical protein n=1 Tax=Pseudorhodoferax sp. Leaf267 TaxID=1736316 RepID=UPI0012E1D046|nr:hypothetical protein [Pseudorhodoferax sp. Leaf267]
MLATMDIDQREAQWRSALALGRPQVLVARADGAVQGFIAFGPSRDADVAPGSAEIWAF